MAYRKVFTDPVPEKKTMYYSGDLTDERGLGIPGATLTTLTLHLYALDASSNTIINNVSGVNILNTGRGTVTSSGNLAITLTPDDAAIITDGLQTPEPHMMLIQWTWPTSKAGGREVQFPVANLTKVS